MKLSLLSLAITTATASTIASDCSSTQTSAITTANTLCAKMANAAAEAAESGSSSTFQEFFKDTSQSTRSQVASNYRKVADECSSTPRGTGTSSCTDRSHNCQGDLLAYTFWNNGPNGQHSGSTYYCPRYFESSILAAKSSRCDEQSQGSNTLHETTHAVLATEDLAYGLANVKALDSRQALMNADSYTYFAIAIDLGCNEGRSSSGGDIGSGSISSSGGLGSNNGGSNGQGSNGYRGFTWRA